MNAEPMDLETLGAGGKLLAIRQMKDRLYLIQAAVTVLASILLLVMDGDLQLVPLFIPVSSFFYLLLIMILIFLGESFVFRYLEIRFAKNSTTRYYMVEKSQKKAVIGFIVVLAFLLVALVPVVGQGMDGFMSADGKTAGSIYFYNKDFSGLTSVKSVTVDSIDDTEVYLVTESTYIAFSGNMEKLKENKLNVHFLLTDSMVIDVPSLDRQMLYLVVNDTTVNYHINTVISPDLVLFLPVFLAAYALFFIGWIAYLMPTRFRLAKDAIYR